MQFHWKRARYADKKITNKINLLKISMHLPEDNELISVQQQSLS